MIAATSRHHGLVVTTPNVRDFKGIPGLLVEDWDAV
jgi:predicted nucleic acid-binding protein